MSTGGLKAHSVYENVVFQAASLQVDPWEVFRDRRGG